MTSYRLTHCGSCSLTDDEQCAAANAAQELCATLGVDMDTAYREHTEAIERGNDNGPATALWCRIEDTAIRAATAGWYRVPDDLSFGPG